MNSMLMMDGTIETRRLLLDDLEGVKQVRAYKQKRLERMLAHKPLPGCEKIAARTRKRYQDEIEDLDRQIRLLEANLEGLG